MTTTEEIEKSRKLDEVVMRVRDGRGLLTKEEAWALMIALAAGRCAMRDRDTLRETVAKLTGKAA